MVKTVKSQDVNIQSEAVVLNQAISELYNELIQNGEPAIKRCLRNTLKDARLCFVIVGRTISAMKEIKAFLASSLEEFKDERNEISSFVCRLNNEIIKSEVFLHFKVCEEMDNSISAQGKQSEYNGFISDCDFVVFLFGKKAGQYTLEEFDVAVSSHDDKGNPIIFPFIRDGNGTDGITALKSRINQDTKIMRLPFMHVDCVKLRILLEIMRLARRNHINLEIDFKDKNAWINGRKILNLENIPAYANNKKIQEALHAREMLKKGFVDSESEHEEFDKEIVVFEHRLLIDLEAIHDFIATENVNDWTKELFMRTEIYASPIGW